MIRTRHLRMASRYLAHRLSELHPYEIQASLLNACNLRCAYCTCPDFKIDLLSTEQWTGIIEKLAAHGTLRIKFQGGEPTMRKDFRQLCAVTQSSGIICAVITNGSEIAKRPKLLDHLDEIVISIDSPTPDVHDRLRGAGSHADAVRTLELAQARGLKPFIAMVVNRVSWDSLEPMLDWCEARGVHLHPQPLIFGRKYYDDKARPLGLSDEQTRAMHRQLALWKKQGRKLMFSPVTYARVSEWDDFGELTRRSEGTSGCMAGRYYLHIEANGDVLPCIQHGSSLIPKNLIRDGFEEALRHTQNHDCGKCFTAYLSERKDLFGLKPGAILTMLRRG